MAFEHFAFRYRDPLTGVWVRARYKATREEIAARHREWETLGPPEIVGGSGTWGAGFRPFGKLVPHSELMRIEERQPDMQPAVSDDERWLARLFLRRYATWCVRRRSFDRAGGAARLYRQLGQQRERPSDPAP